MIRLAPKRRFGPIGVDIGSHSVKLVQLTADRTRLVQAARWDYAARLDRRATMAEAGEQVAKALQQARQGRAFRGRDAVLCLGERELSLQNIRLPKGDPSQLPRLVQQEAAGKLSYPIEQAEIRFVEAGQVQQTGATRREVILLACHRPQLEHLLQTVECGGLRPVAVDVEPAALLRGHTSQFRRDEDRQQCLMLVHVGYAKTTVVIGQGDQLLFAKYLDFGGHDLDESVASQLRMDRSGASALRRHNGDRRADQQDPEVARGIADAVRPVIERLAAEVSMCIRYHSVTFRGRALTRLVLGGGEASEALLELLSARLDIECELGNPLRSYQSAGSLGQPGQWDVAAGLALRAME